MLANQGYGLHRGFGHVGFLGGILHFFFFIFGKTFHYTNEGWYKLTRNVAWFFLFTAVINEAVRLGFHNVEIFTAHRVLTGIDIWILFKLFVIMPVTALFFWWQVRVMQQYRLPEPVPAQTPTRPKT